MIDKIENKIAEVVEAILDKPASDFTEKDFNILTSEYSRLKMKSDFEAKNKHMAEMLTTLWTK